MAGVLEAVIVLLDPGLWVRGHVALAALSVLTGLFFIVYRPRSSA